MHGEILRSAETREPGSRSLRTTGNGRGTMNKLTIEVWDATGNKKQLVELPSGQDRLECALRDRAQ